MRWSRLSNRAVPGASFSVVDFTSSSSSVEQRTSRARGHGPPGGDPCASTPKFPQLVNRQIPAPGVLSFRLA